MVFARVRPLRWLLNLALCLLLIGLTDLGLARQKDADGSFATDSDALTLPPANSDEMQEAMPELQLFQPQDPSLMLPQLGDPLGSPGL